MEPTQTEVASRRLLIGTTHGVIEGDLALAPQVRTLDFLNRGSTRFVSLHAAKARNARFPLLRDSVHINIATILWVTELASARRSGGTGAKPKLTRSALRFSFADGEILGFLHTPAQGDPFARLNQERGLFIAVTSASITGQDTEMAAPFLAVTSAHVVTIEAMTPDEDIQGEPAVFEEARS